jgi:hypothetical protein
MCNHTCVMWDNTAKNAIAALMRSALLSYADGDFAQSLQYIKLARITHGYMPLADLIDQIDRLAIARHAANEAAAEWPGSLACIPGHIDDFRGKRPVRIVSSTPDQRRRDGMHLAHVATEVEAPDLLTRRHLRTVS